MAYFKQTVLLYKQQDDGFAATPYTISDAYDINVERVLSDRKDTFQFKILNSNNKYFSGSKRFEIGDNIKIYVWANAANYTDPTHLLIDGIITEPPMSITDKGKVLTIKGFSKIDIVFNTLIFMKRDNLTLPLTIKQILDEVNGSSFLRDNSPKKVRYTYLGSDGDTIYNEEGVVVGTLSGGDSPTIAYADSAGSAFSESINTKEIYRRGSELLRKYSATTYTKDGDYYIWLDVENYFHWQPRLITTSTGLVEGTDPQEITVSISKDGIINALIINVGNSPSNKGNTTYAVNPASITQHGAKWKYIPNFRGTGEELMTMEEKTNPASFGKTDRFPTPTSYPYTTTNLEFSNGSGDDSTVADHESGTPVICANDDDYESAIRLESEYVGEQRGQDILSFSANPRWTSEMTLPHTLEYGVTSFIPHTITSYNFVEKNLRCGKLMFGFWTTKLTSEEDVEDAGGT